MKLPTTTGLVLLLSTLAIAAQVQSRDENSEVEQKMDKLSKVGRDVESIELAKRKKGGGAVVTDGAATIAVSYGALAVVVGATVFTL